MNWIITGGAGYIGSHVVQETLKSGRKVVVLDDLSTGIASRIPEGVALENVSLSDKAGIRSLFEKHEIHGVLHLAAKKSVSESVERPTYYWQENIGGLDNLLNAMADNNVKKFVFSSSAAVYGQPEIGAEDLITEQTPCQPINPYGATKLVGEWYANARTVIDGLSVTALRYFNVAGAGQPELGDVFAFNLVPLIFEAIDNGKNPRIYGDDYPTADGTCIRDYIHVQDLAEAHVAAMDVVNAQETGFQAINIGTGKGSSVREVIDMVQWVTSLELHPDVIERRTGDPAQLVACVDRAKELLGWSCKYDLHDIVASAWDAWRRHTSLKH